MYAVIPTGNGGQEGLQLPHVVPWAQRALQGLSTEYSGVFLVKVGYVRATSDQPQLRHRNPPRGLQTAGVEQAFSCFMLVKLDCRMDGRANMFVYGFGCGDPHPWQELSMSIDGRPVDLEQLHHLPWWGCLERCAAWINPYHCPCRPCRTPRRLRDHRADHPATLG